jgi:hypothetical protein
MQMDLLRFVVLIGAVAFSGCLSPMHVRMPTLHPTDPRIEKRVIETYDPYPDRKAGPDTAGRPRGYSRQRAESRRAVEGRQMLGLRLEQGATAPRSPTSQGNYRQSVRE